VKRNGLIDLKIDHFLQHNARFLLVVFLLSMFFFVPITFYFIGDGYGFGIQGFFYRFQVTAQGVSFLPISYEIDYILNLTITGKTVYSILFWVIGTLFYTCGMIWYMLTYDSPDIRYIKVGVILIFISIISIIISQIIQYGPFFLGPAGLSIPIGFPLLTGLAWFMNSLPEQRSFEQ
jgi:hypothetical protein